MNVFQQVRDIESETDAQAEVRVRAARDTLMREMSRPRRKRSRARVWGGITLGGAATATAAIVAATVVGTTAVAPIAPDPAVAQVVNQVADLTLTAADAELQPGQYLRITKYNTFLAYWDADAANGFNMGSPENGEGAVLSETKVVMYVPADRSDDWIIDGTSPTEVKAVYGDPAAGQNYELSAGARDVQGLQAWPAGVRAGNDSWDQRFLALADTLPRDPEELLTWFRNDMEDMGDDEGESWSIFNIVVNALNLNALPADLRAALLRMLAYIPYLTVGPTVDNTVTIEWRSEQQPGMPDPSGFGPLHVQSLVLDTSTGHILGYTDSYPERLATVAPADIPHYAVRYEVDIVDEAPAP